MARPTAIAARHPSAAHLATALAGALVLLAPACSGSTDTPTAGTTSTSRPALPATAPPAPGTDCDWPMFGQNLDRTFSQPCPTGISPATAGDLTQRWFFNTYDVVTTTPAVVDGTVYVGDWSGRFYAVDAETGTERWSIQAETHPEVYAGQIVSSPAVAEVDGTPLVFFASGQTMYAVAAADGAVRWTHDIGTGASPDYTEIESSPVVADGMVVFGSDVHNDTTAHAGVFALDARTGEQRWFYNSDEGQPPSGCADVWGSPSVDLTRRRVFVGTGNCPKYQTNFRPTTEAILSLDLDTGERQWAYQPHEPNPNDIDFAGAPNLFRIDGRDVVGLGSKDGVYHVVDRDSGELVWKTQVAEGGGTGGFIGAVAVARGIVAGGTALGGEPFLHGLDAATGRILWQQPKAQATYAASAEAGGVLFLGGTDFTVRAVDLATGEVLWSQPVNGVVSGGAAIVGDDVFMVAGMREPGVGGRIDNAGLYRFSIAPGGPTASSSTTTTTAAAVTGVDLTNPPDQRCIASACPFGFLKGIPAGHSGPAPTATLKVGTTPFSARVETTNLGDPSSWITAGTDAATEGATTFGVFASESDANPVGGLLCIIGTDGTCETDALPRLATYNRVTILAVRDTSSFPTPADGLARLVATITFEPPLTPVGVTPTTEPAG